MPATAARSLDIRLCSDFAIAQLLAAVARKNRSQMESESLAVGTRLLPVVRPVQAGHPYPYPAEEDLLASQQNVADFHILVLADHFRSYYTVGRLPKPLAARYIGRLSFKHVGLRLSGHVTGTFAEAMAPWALNALGIAAPNEVFRLRRLQPSAFRRAPDLVITKTSPPLPV